MLKEKILTVAEWCCKNGVVPFPIDGTSLTMSQEVRNAHKDVLAYAKSLKDVDLSAADIDLFPREYFIEKILISAGIKFLHLQMLCSPEQFDHLIKKVMPEYSQLISDDRDDRGLVDVRGLVPEGRPYCWQSPSGKKFDVFSSIVGALNASLKLQDNLVLLTAQDSTEVKIRPNPWRFFPSSEYSTYEEKDWYSGKKFNYEWLKGLREKIETTYGPGFENNNGGYRTQFCWEPQKDGTIKFSCEELSVGEDVHDIIPISLRTLKFTTRFCHGIYCPRKELFDHFDGHLHIYDVSEYEERQKRNLSNHGISFIKAKIFRVDEGLEKKPFERLLESFYRWNPVVMEYFTPKYDDMR